MTARLLPLLFVVLLPFAAVAQSTFDLSWEETVITSVEIDSTFLFHGDLTNTTDSEIIYTIQVLDDQVEMPDMWSVQICTHFTCYAPFLHTVDDTLAGGETDELLSIDVNAFTDEGVAIIPTLIFDPALPDEAVETTFYLYAGPNDVEGTVVTRPVNHELNAVYPNPFNAAANVRFTLASPADARITLHDVTGRQVLELVHGVLPQGQHVRSLNAASLASGTYFIRMAAEGQSFVRPVTLVK